MTEYCSCGKRHWLFRIIAGVKHYKCLECGRTFTTFKQAPYVTKAAKSAENREYSHYRNGSGVGGVHVAAFR